MRPKKHILLVDADEDRQSIQAFVLWVHERRVTRAKSAKQASKANRVDLVLVVGDHDCNMKALFPATPVLSIGMNKWADVWIANSSSQTAILDAVRQLLKRKTGPKTAGGETFAIKPFPIDENGRHGHGSNACYNRGCRRDECRRAHALAERRRRYQSRGAEEVEVVGTPPRKEPESVSAHDCIDGTRIVRVNGRFITVACSECLARKKAA